jgi:hypothetical protein
MKEVCGKGGVRPRNLTLSTLIAFGFLSPTRREKKSFDLFGSGRQLWLVLIDIKCGGAAKKTPTEVLRQRGEISTGSISETPSVSIIQTC